MGTRGAHVPLTIPGDAGDPRGFVTLVEEFCADLSARGNSPATVRNRRHMLAQLAGWLGDRGVTRPVEVTRPMLVRYQRHLFHYRKTNGDPLSFHSQAQRLLPVRAFFKWAVRNAHVLSNPASEIELPRLEHRLPKPALSVAEAELVLAQPDTATVMGLRDRAMLEVLYSTGIRRADSRTCTSSTSTPTGAPWWSARGKGAGTAPSRSDPEHSRGWSVTSPKPDPGSRSNRTPGGCSSPPTGPCSASTG
jgi:integrase/recombinase XerD